MYIVKHSIDNGVTWKTGCRWSTKGDAEFNAQTVCLLSPMLDGRIARVYLGKKIVAEYRKEDETQSE